MKYLILILLFASCDYNLKTDRDLLIYESRIEEERQNAEIDRSFLSAQIDSLMVVYQNEKKMRLRLQDSLKWADLRSVSCWESGEHKHNCENYE